MPKTRNSKPTIKQKMVFEKVIKGGSSISKAMREAGYKSTAKNTEKITKSKGWKELLQQNLPDSLLTKKHLELFDLKQLNYFVFPKTMEDEEIIEHVASVGIKVITVRPSDKGKMAFYTMPDANSMRNGLDMAYKLKGHYEAEKHDVTHKGLNLIDLYDRSTGN